MTRPAPHRHRYRDDGPSLAWPDSGLRRVKCALCGHVALRAISLVPESAPALAAVEPPSRAVRRSAGSGRQRKGGGPTTSEGAVDEHDALEAR